VKTPYVAVVLCPYPFAALRVRCARFCAARIAALGGACFFLGFAASATILEFLAVSEELKEKKNMRVLHVPLEFASLFVRLVWHGALEDRAEEQEPPCAVVQLLVGRAVVLQHVIYNLPTPRVSTVNGEGTM